MRRAGAALLAVPLLLGALLGTVSAAHADGAQAQGWWSAAHRSSLPAPPSPPDVAADDLLLQGGDPARLLPAGVLEQNPSPSAYAALRFIVPLGASVAGLTLPVAAGAQAADVRAYPTRMSWAPVQGGAIEQAPAPDLSRYSQGALTPDGAALVFRDLGRLMDDSGVLSVVLVPGPADRVVVHRPPTTALAVTPAAAQPASPAPDPAPPPLPVAGGVGYVPAPALVPAPVPAAAPAPESAPFAAPVAAPVSSTPARRALVPRLVPRLVGDDARTRVLVGLEAVLVLVLFGLAGWGPLRALARWTGAQLEIDPERGVGRFRAVRAGPPPTL